MAAHARRALALALTLLLVGAAAASANRAYDRVAAAYAQAGGQLDPCAFTTAQLQAGLDGIPRAIARYVPDLRRAIQQGIAARERGDCAGRKPGTTTTPAPASGGSLAPPEVAPGAPTTEAESPPAATTTPAQQPAGGARARDATPLFAVLVAIGALALLALALWGWARLRGWDPTWVARARHAWGEAGLRTTSTWSEFADWLRPGR